MKVLQANGFEVVIPPDQGCCGAVSHHQGELELTRQLATDLIQGELDAVLVAASGCGHTMKAYGELLNGNTAFRAPVLDVRNSWQTAAFWSRSAPNCNRSPAPWPCMTPVT